MNSAVLMLHVCATVENIEVALTGISPLLPNSVLTLSALIKILYLRIPDARNCNRHQWLNLHFDPHSKYLEINKDIKSKTTYFMPMQYNTLNSTLLIPVYTYY